MKILLPVIAWLVLATSVGISQDRLVKEGTYFGGGAGGDVAVDLLHLDDEIYEISIFTTVNDGQFSGCAGGIDGEMSMSGNIGTLLVENLDYDPDVGGPMFGHQFCEIGLTFTKDGFLVVEEKEGCLAFHGAACTFSGKLVHEEAAG